MTDLLDRAWSALLELQAEYLCGKGSCQSGAPFEASILGSQSAAMPPQLLFCDIRSATATSIMVQRNRLTCLRALRSSQILQHDIRGMRSHPSPPRPRSVRAASTRGQLPCQKLCLKRATGPTRLCRWMVYSRATTSWRALRPVAPFEAGFAFEDMTAGWLFFSSNYLDAHSTRVETHLRRSGRMRVQTCWSLVAGVEDDFGAVCRASVKRRVSAPRAVTCTNTALPRRGDDEASVQAQAPLL